jgi:CubicO group peptidase (beta-lactamase class C family)
MKRIRFYHSFLTILFFNSVVSAQPDSLARKIESIFKTYNTPAGPGCVVTVIRNDTVVFNRGFGMANLEYDILITPSTVFDVASVSKQFTGFAIATLIQQGTVSPQDDIRKYLPDVPSFGKTITINHLIHHTSGLRDWPEALSVAGWRWDDVFSFVDIMEMIKNQKELDFEPGTKYSYSNTGYNLLAAIVEKVSGKSFRDWTSENIFQPLGMNSSQFQDDYTRIIRNLAYSYEPRAHGFAKTSGALTAYGSSSLFTTAEDLSKWVIHFNRQIASGNTVYLHMLTQGKLSTGQDVPYGYGLATGMHRGLKMVSHTGGWAGYRTIIENFPDESLSIIVLSNSADCNPGRYAADIADLFLNKKWKTTPAVVNKIKESPSVVLDATLAGKLAGAYLLRPGKLVTITYEDGKLMTQATGEPKFPTDAKSDSTIWIDAYDAPMTFVRDTKTGKVLMVRYRDIHAKRVEPWIPDPNFFGQYTGTFYSEELAAAYTIALKEGKLEMSHRRGGTVVILPDPSVPDLFNGSGMIQFTRNKQKQISGFRLSGGRVKNITFEKR